MTRKAESGFTLVELMVVVALIGIISSIAFPFFQGSICDTNKGQAVVDLNVCVMALERYYSGDFTFVGAVIDDTASSVCNNQSPSKGTTRYVITLESAAASTFTVRATPTAAAGSCSSTIELTADGTQTEL